MYIMDFEDSDELNATSVRDNDSDINSTIKYFIRIRVNIWLKAKFELNNNS